MSDVQWLVGWYARRRHAVREVVPGIVTCKSTAVCGALTFHSDMAARKDQWRARLMDRKPPPRCKHCEREIAKCGPAMSDEEWRAFVLQIVGSLTLCDHMGDVANDVEIILARIGFEAEWDDLNELGEILGEAGVTTLYNTSLKDA